MKPKLGLELYGMDKIFFTASEAKIFAEMAARDAFTTATMWCRVDIW